MNINACNWKIVMQYIQSQCNKNIGTHHISIMVLSITHYMIWKERNVGRFQHIHQSVQELLNQIKKIVYISGLKSKKTKSLMLSLCGLWILLFFFFFEINSCFFVLLLLVTM